MALGGPPAGGPTASAGHGGRPFPGVREGGGDPFAFGAYRGEGAATGAAGEDTGGLMAYPEGSYQAGGYRSSSPQAGGYQSGTYETGAHQAGTHQGAVYEAGTHETGAYRAGAYLAGDSTETFTAIPGEDEAPARGQSSESTETFPAVPPGGQDGSPAGR